MYNRVSEREAVSVMTGPHSESFLYHTDSIDVCIRGVRSIYKMSVKVTGCLCSTADWLTSQPLVCVCPIDLESMDCVIDLESMVCVIDLESMVGTYFIIDTAVMLYSHTLPQWTDTVGCAISDTRP